MTSPHRESDVEAAKRTKILIVGNYDQESQPSMKRYTDLLHEMNKREMDVTLIYPPMIFGNIFKSKNIAKWTGYIDKFIIFSIFVTFYARRFDIIHICDQAYAIYFLLPTSKYKVITCHDVMQIQSSLGLHRENTVGFTGRIYQNLILKGLKKADSVICVSSSTQTGLTELGVDPAKTVIIQNVVGPEFERMDDKLAWDSLKSSSLRRGDCFLFHVGNNNWYKNRPMVVEIFRELSHFSGLEGCKLVLAGSPANDELARTIETSGVSDRIVLFGYADDIQLNALYSLAKALIFPSLIEGFGWPIAEAQCCGCPVFTSAREPMISVGGTAARYFDPTDPAAAAKSIADGLSDTAKMTEDGYQNARRYHIDAIQPLLRAEYQRLLSSR